MNRPNHLTLALQQTRFAATQHQNMAAQCSALSALVEAMTKASDQPHPIEALAQALLPFDLCIVHKDAVQSALTVVHESNEVSGIARDPLLKLERTLNAALTGRAY